MSQPTTNAQEVVVFNHRANDTESIEISKNPPQQPPSDGIDVDVLPSESRSSPRPSNGNGLPTFASGAPAPAATRKRYAYAVGVIAAAGVVAGVGAFIVSSRNASVSKQLQQQSKMAMVSSTKSGKSKTECYFDAVTESYIKGSENNPVLTDTAGNYYTSKTNQYFWGVNAVCEDPNFVYDPTVTGTASYCNDKNADAENPNAVQVGSARGYCFVAPTQFGDDECEDEGLYGCEWSCEEVLVVNGDYLFLKYLYQDDDSSAEGDLLGYPREFEVIVTGGTGCYQNVDNAIIPGYTEYSDTYYYTYDLSPLKKK